MRRTARGASRDDQSIVDACCVETRLNPSLPTRSGLRADRKAKRPPNAVMSLGRDEAPAVAAVAGVARSNLCNGNAADANLLGHCLASARRRRTRRLSALALAL